MFRASNFDIRNYVAYYLPRKNFFLNRFLTKGGQYPDYTIRLYRNGFARFPCKDVHENVEIINPKSKIQISNQIQNPNDKISNNNLTMKQFNNETVGYLKYPILHYADPTFSRFLKRWDRYTSLEANKLLQEVKSQKSKVKSLTMFIDYFFIKPLVWFFLAYFRHRGYVDGFPGFVFALFSSLRFWAIFIKFYSHKNQLTQLQ